MRIYVKSIQQFKHKFEDASLSRELKMGERDIQDLLAYVSNQKEMFKDDFHFGQRIVKSALKLLMLHLKPPSPFFSNSCAVQDVCKLAIGR